MSVIYASNCALPRFSMFDYTALKKDSASVPAPLENAYRIPAKELRELLDYDRRTGRFTWRVNRGRMVKAGDRAGTRRKDGSIGITISGHVYMANRLAWLWVTGDWPPGRLTTYDRNPANLRWRNLLLESETHVVGESAAYQRERRYRQRKLDETGNPNLTRDEYHDPHDPRDPRNAHLWKRPDRIKK